MFRLLFKAVLLCALVVPNISLNAQTTAEISPPSLRELKKERAPEQPSRSTDQNKVREGVIPDLGETINPRVSFLYVSINCLYPGGRFNVVGRNLDLLKGQVFSLKADSYTYRLQMIQHSKNTISFFLPEQTGSEADNRLEPKIFQLVYSNHSTENGKPTVFTGQKIEVCEDPVKQVQIAEQKAEIAILVNVDRETEALAEIQKRQLDLIAVHRLQSMQSVLFHILSNDAPSLLRELRQAIPEAKVDYNGNLAAAAGPRLYAKKIISWGSDNNCPEIGKDISLGVLDGQIIDEFNGFSADNLVVGNFLSGAQADISHATAIGSILVGNNPDKGLTGLIPGAKIFNAVVLRSSGNGKSLASIVALLRGLDWLMEKKVRLINVSLATPQQNSVLLEGIIKSLERGAIIFAAAGNQGPQAGPSYPASIDGVFSITAIDANKRVYEQANQGDFIDFAAPGVDIWSADGDRGGRYVSGTSFATPFVLAIAAQVLARNPSVSATVIRRAMASTSLDLGIKGKDPIFGLGLVQSLC